MPFSSLTLHTLPKIFHWQVEEKNNQTFTFILRLRCNLLPFICVGKLFV